MAMSVDVSVEAAAENQIKEVHLDGREIYVEPLSMSETLSKLAHKIDFSKDESEEKGKPTSEVEKDKEEEASSSVTFHPPTWCWESVHTKLKAALTEVNVLLDVLTIAKEKRYMVLDPVQGEPQESKIGITLQSKKTALAGAGLILQTGAERLRKYHTEQTNRRTQNEFHMDLLRLRQDWRLRRVGKMILGDLSYKSAGSRFWAGGTFEVSKSETEGSLLDSPGAQPRCSLQVTVPSELEGIAYIQVSIRNLADVSNLHSMDLSLQNNFGGPVPQDAHWKLKLDAAANVIFCKEVFAQLSREATQFPSAVPHLVVSNQIFSQLLPGYQLCIALCHQTDKDKKLPVQALKQEHNHVLEHSLHQLLRTLHFKNLHHTMPHPVTAMVGMTKRRRLAGPQGMSRDDLLTMSSNETLLEQIIKQAKHYLLYRRVLSLVDNLAQTISDPNLFVHWCNISSATEASVKLVLSATNYENVRTPIVLHVGVDSVKAVCRDGRTLTLSYEEQEITDLIKSQVAWHHVSCIQYICKMIGWQILSLNLHTGAGNVEPQGNASSIMLASPCSTKIVSIKAGPLTGPEVWVQSIPVEDANFSPIITDPKWLHVGAQFKQVNLQQLPGKNFINKVELLMAGLNNRPKSTPATNI